MTDHSPNTCESSSIEEILRERERLTETLKKEYKQEISILFTDICGYTQFMDTHGDITGMGLVQRHNDIVFPQIEKFGGKVIKTIGDAVMATFGSNLSAVRAAIGIQKGLDQHNKGADPGKEIKVKIGINSGDVLVDEKDVFGDAVNVASRIQSKAGADEILIPKIAYDQVGGVDDIICRWYGNVEVKGKSKALELYRVVWRDERILPDIEAKVRSFVPEKDPIIQAESYILELEINRKGAEIEISANEHKLGDATSIRDYEKFSFEISSIESLCTEMVNSLNSANRGGQLSTKALIDLRRLGQNLFNSFFTERIKNKINHTQATFLSLHIDDQLVHIPWELMHNGTLFLCKKFNMGRLVKTSQQISAMSNAKLAKPMRMLAFANLTDDLHNAHKECADIRKIWEKHPRLVQISSRSDKMTPEFILNNFQNFDMIHFAGHAAYQLEQPEESGWQLLGGILKARDVIQMAGKTAMPHLVFSNACQSARTETWDLDLHVHNKIFGLANAFLLTGVKHYIGTMWEIIDDPSRAFATSFYQHIIEGEAIGEALRNARLDMVKQFGDESLVWASYILYGDPTYNYLHQIDGITEKKAVSQALEQNQKPIADPLPDQAANGIILESGVQQATKPKIETKTNRHYLKIAAIVFFVLLVGIIGIIHWQSPHTKPMETRAITQYKEGNFDKALIICSSIENISEEIRLPHLIRAGIGLRSGNLKQAQKGYQRAINAKRGTSQQLAEAYSGLGRIASIQGHTSQAHEYYQKAIDVNPSANQAYIAKALLYEKNGELDHSLQQLRKINTPLSQNSPILTFQKEIEDQLAFEKDKEKKAQIDKLIAELLAKMKQPGAVIEISDGWTSRPLTIWVLDFDVKGYAINEAEDRIIKSKLSDALLNSSRIQLVERALIDKLLEELKLSSSKLVDPNSALTLGKLMAARLILSGELIYLGPITQLSIRVIETETGRVVAGVSHDFKLNTSIAQLSTQISQKIIGRTVHQFPFRGKILEKTGTMIKINIGQQHGVQIGQKFQLVEKDAQIEIVRILNDYCMAKALKGLSHIEAGDRVEEINAPI